MKDTYAPYLKLSFSFVVLFLLSFLAFYPRYFGVLNATPWFVHLHYVLMVMWTVMLVLQPFLIRRRNFDWHRKIGRTSYVLVPIILISGYSLLRHSYQGSIDALHTEVAAGKSALTETEIIHQARASTGLPVYYGALLLLFYPLAIINKRKPLVHATYIIVAGLSIAGPIVDRAVYYAVAETIGSPVFGFEFVAFVLLDLMAIGLLYLAYRQKRSPIPAVLCLAVIAGGQLVYIFFLDSALWQGFVGLIL